MQRNIKNLIGDNLDATDGEIGTVEDFYFDDHTWTVRYLGVKTGNWLSRHNVLISPSTVLPHSWESGMFPVGLTKEQIRHSPDIDMERAAPKGNPHLRSTQKMTGYHIHASDGDIGHVTDFIMDDQTWWISYLVVDTHSWIGGKRVLIAVRHVKEVKWENSKVVVKITTEAIKKSSAIDPWNYIIPEGDRLTRMTPVLVA